jgi:hypothetical protein
MKKIAVILAMLSTLFFSSSMGVWAASDPKDIDVILSDTASVMQIGETVELTATTDKHGSTYTDKWDNAEKIATVFVSQTGTYISKASFTAERPGRYYISYTINMTSGSSNTVFTKKVERTIVVADSAKVVGALIKDLTVKPVYRSDGSISAYRAFGATYALWSDNTSALNGSVCFSFSPEETSTDVDVTLYINDRPYSYTVTVTR